MKNIYDAFLTVSTERKKKKNVLENSADILQSESYHSAASFSLGGKRPQLYVLYFLAKLYFEKSEYCWIGVRIMELNFKNPGDGGKPSPCTPLLLPNALEQGSLEDKHKEQKSTSNSAIWHFLQRPRREPEFSPWGFGRPTWISYLIGRSATGPSHTQFMTSLPLWAAAQSSPGRADLPRKVHRHMADPTTAPPTGWGLAPRRGWLGRQSSQRNPFNTFLHSFCRYRPGGQAKLKANTPAQPAVFAGRRACIFTETKITEPTVFYRSFSGVILFHYICLGS